MPRLDFRAAPELTPADRTMFSTNWRTAIEHSCAAGTFANRPLVDPRSFNRNLIYVTTAPEANVPSIYFAPSAAPPATMMEIPFGPQRPVPAIEDLREAIHCWIKGPSADEELALGRCLVD